MATLKESAEKEDDAARRALKEEIKAELRAEMEAERAAREAEEKPKHAVDPQTVHFKPGSGLHLESEDGQFALTTRARVQLLQSVEVPRGGDSQEPEQVFQIRRARLQMKGHTFGKHNKFKLELAFSPRDLGVRDGVVRNTPLLTWYVELDHLRDLTVRAGQYKIPYSRQRVISSGDLQLVDRALANGEFNHDRDIGLDLRSTDLGGLGGHLRYYVGVYMGEGRDFGDRNATPDFNLHYLGRIEILPMGDFDDYKEADLKRHESPKLSLGGAYSFHHQAQRDRGVLGSQPEDGGTSDYHSATADYMFKFAGFSSSGEFFWRQGTRIAPEATDDTPAPASLVAPRDGIGWFVQAGYVFPGTPVEIAGRYSGIRGRGTEDPGGLTDTRGFTSLTQSDSAGGGIGYYFGGHPLKLQADYFNTWLRGDTSVGDSTVRVQLQLAL